MRIWRNRKGSAIVEAALMMPWVLFLFFGILDSGFYTYSAIATQNAARAVAIQAANLGGTMSNAAMCQAVKNELAFLPNVGSVGTCAGSFGAVSNSAPMWVCAGILNDTASAPCVPPAVKCADCAGSGATGTSATSVQAVVTYQSIPLIPIPGILPVQLQLTRIAEARVIQ
jgi:Flp pilus assembly protein TadG